MRRFRDEQEEQSGTIRRDPVGVRGRRDDQSAGEEAWGAPANGAPAPIANGLQAFRILFETAPDQALHLRGHSLPLWLVLDHQGQRFCGVIALKQPLTRQHLVEHHAEGPDVGALVHLFAARLKTFVDESTPGEGHPTGLFYGSLAEFVGELVGTAIRGAARKAARKWNIFSKDGSPPQTPCRPNRRLRRRSVRWLWFWLVLNGFGFGSNWFWLVLVGDGSGPAPFRGSKVTMLHGHGSLSKCWAHARRDRTQN